MDRQIKRGDVYWATFDDPIGKHPVVVVQNDIGNKYAPNVIIVMVTSAPADKEYPTDVLLPDGFLPLRNSRVLTSTVLTIEKITLEKFIASLPKKVMIKIDSALKLSLSLE